MNMKDNVITGVPPGGVILSAGADVVPELEDPRRAAVKLARKVLRDPGATDAQVDDALEALIELAKG